MASEYTRAGDPKAGTSSTTELTEVEGIFRDREAVEDAVYALGQQSVPSDSIHVYVADTDGRRTRELNVEREAGTLRGALYGALGGAVVGLAIVLAIPTGAFGPVSIEFLTADTLLGAIRVIVTLAVAGVPLGAILGMGHWRGGERISAEELGDGALVVTVRSDELADTARQVLRDAGAERVTG
jgi:hypothetical protein